MKRTSFLALLAAGALSACAMPVKADETSPLRAERIQHACRDIMGLTPGETLYENCLLSLRQTMAAVDQAAEVQQAREACFAQGTQPGTPEFAHCVVKSSSR